MAKHRMAGVAPLDSADVVRDAASVSSGDAIFDTHPSSDFESISLLDIASDTRRGVDPTGLDAGPRNSAVKNGDLQESRVRSGVRDVVETSAPTDKSTHVGQFDPLNDPIEHLMDLSGDPAAPVRRRESLLYHLIDMLLDNNSNDSCQLDAIVNSMTNDEVSVLRRAQELVRKHDEEVRAKRIERDGRVRQVAALTASYGAECTQRLAEILELPENEGPLAGMTWKLSESGEKLISFNAEDNDLMVDMHRMPMLVTDFEGYAVGANHLLGTDVYGFGLTDGGENWSGFDDLETFGRATLQLPSGRYKWSEVSLSEYNE